MRFAFMETGVQDAMLDVFFFEKFGKQLRFFDRHGANKNWLPAVIGFSDGLGNSTKFVLRIFIELVVLIDAQHGHVGWNFYNVEFVNFVKFACLGGGGSGHARQFGVHPEIILEGNGRQRLVFWLNLDTFFGLDRLMQAV